MDLYKFRSGHSLLVQTGQYSSGETMVCWGWFILAQWELMLNFQKSFEKANFILVSGNWQWWENLHHGNWPTLQGRAFPNPWPLLNIYQHTTSYLQLYFSPACALLGAFHSTLHYFAHKNPQWMLSGWMIPIEYFSYLLLYDKPFQTQWWNTHHFIMLRDSVGQEIRPEQGLSCIVIWEHLMGWVDSKAELSWDPWPEDWHTASPCDFCFL